jgi:hypothetical protein
MPTPTYTPLATVTLASTASSVTFSSIPATYRDLVVVHNNFGTVNNDANSNFRFNGDSGSNYSRVYAFWSGSIVSGAATGGKLYERFWFTYNCGRQYLSHNGLFRN